MAEELSDIERRLAEDRDALARSLDLLSNTLSPDRLKTEASETANRLGSEIGGEAWRAARENPAAFALVGAGLALLLSGAGKRSEQAARHRARMAEADDPATVPPMEAMDGFDDRVARADARMRVGIAEEERRSASSQRLRSALNTGLEKLPPKARLRVIQAREQAISAQEAVERRARQTAQ